MKKGNAQMSELKNKNNGGLRRDNFCPESQLQSSLCEVVKSKEVFADTL